MTDHSPRGGLVLEARDLARHYEVKRGFFGRPAAVKALAGVSLPSQQGETLAVVGESGSGKSTLSRLLTLIEPPTAGTLLIEGADVTRRRRCLAQTPAPRHPDGLPEPLWIAQPAPDHRRRRSRNR